MVRSGGARWSTELCRPEPTSLGPILGGIVPSLHLPRFTGRSREGSSERERERERAEAAGGKDVSASNSRAQVLRCGSFDGVLPAARARRGLFRVANRNARRRSKREKNLQREVDWCISPCQRWSIEHGLPNEYLSADARNGERERLVEVSHESYLFNVFPVGEYWRQ